MVACLLGVLNDRLKYRYQRTARTTEVRFGLKLQEGTTRPGVNKAVKRLRMYELYNGQQLRFWLSEPICLTGFTNKHTGHEIMCL